MFPSTYHLPETLKNMLLNCPKNRLKPALHVCWGPPNNPVKGISKHKAKEDEDSSSENSSSVVIQFPNRAPMSRGTQLCETMRNHVKPVKERGASKKSRKSTWFGHSVKDDPGAAGIRLVRRDLFVISSIPKCTRSCSWVEKGSSIHQTGLSVTLSFVSLLVMIPTPERAYSPAPLRLRSVGSLLRSGKPAVHRGGFGGLSCWKLGFQKLNTRLRTDTLNPWNVKCFNNVYQVVSSCLPHCTRQKQVDESDEGPSSQVLVIQWACCINSICSRPI